MCFQNEQLELDSKFLGALPIANHFLARLRVEKLFYKRLPPPDRRSKISPSLVLMLLLRSLVVCRIPLYSLGGWAQSIAPEALQLTTEQVAALNDDRIGRALDELFDSDRQALLTDLVINMIREFRINLEELHNDSTSLTFQGDYRQGDGREVAGKATPRVTFGHNKDHRPDLKQLLWILTVSSDGAVPVHFKVTDGNVEDSTTHIETWNLLRRLVGTPQFLYVADCKLCTSENLRYIDQQQGCFVTPIPQSRKEDGWFRQWLCSHDPEWVEIARFLRPGQQAEAANIIKAMESPIPDVNGFRLIWFFSSHKCQRDAEKRQDAIIRAIKGLEELRTRLQGPRCRFRNVRMVTQAVTAILNKAGASRWIKYRVQWSHDIAWRRKKRKGKDGMVRKGTYRRLRFELVWESHQDNIQADSKSDGVSPLLTNRRDLSHLQVYTAYHRNQYFLEKRHDLLKNTLQVTPAFLHTVSRLEAFLFLEYLALTVHALVERELRRRMNEEKIEQLPLYPEARECRAPTAARLFDLFEHVQVHTLSTQGQTIRTFPPTLTKLQLDLLELLAIPAVKYVGCV